MGVAEHGSMDDGRVLWRQKADTGVNANRRRILQRSLTGSKINCNIVFSGNLQLTLLMCLLYRTTQSFLNNPH